MTRHLGVLLDWTLIDVIVLAFAIQQYVSISLDLKKSRVAEQNSAQKSAQPGHPEGQHGPHQGA